jgi:ribosomal protein S8
MKTALKHRFISVFYSKQSDRMIVRLLIKLNYMSFYRLSEKYTKKGNVRINLNLRRVSLTTVPVKKQ